jgi:hypothetical protein
MSAKWNLVLVVAVVVFLMGPAVSAGRGADPMPQLFVTGDQCMACHNGLVTPEGTDVSIGTDWRASMMANAARDPYWQAAVRRETLDHPTASAAIQHECAACHMPMTRYRAKLAGAKGEVFAHLPIGGSKEPAGLLAADGVSCTVCHQIGEEKLGNEASFTAGFVVDSRTAFGKRHVFGPYDIDTGRAALMQSGSRFRPATGTHIQSSELCASCHTLYTHSLDGDGNVIGALPEQVPYLEWKHSGYADHRSCQSCHMPEVETDVPIASVLGEPRSEVSRHVFRGGNFFMPKILGFHGDELGVQALPQELETVSWRTEQHLKTSAAELTVKNVELSGERLVAEVLIRNLVGHRLPTAYPSRRAWVHLTVRDRAGNPVFESGRLESNGSILGNDNDADPERYESHYAEISSPDQVQIYEAIMAGPDDEVTTGLLTAVRYLKDNRLPPDGFDKTTAHEDIAVRGRAGDDADFDDGSDRVRYSVPVSPEDGPFKVQAELWYQPIGYRWAHNLSNRQAPEIDRFVTYYEQAADVSGIVLARDSVDSE